MKIVTVISENKKRKRSSYDSTSFKSMRGHCEAIVEENGRLRTKHMIAIPGYQQTAQDIEEDQIVYGRGR